MWSCERIIAVVFAIALLLAGATGANAQGNAQANAQAYEAALVGFTKDSFNETDSAISAVAASGSPLALDVITALQDGRLLYGADKVFIRDKAGAILDAATGQPVAGAPSDIKNVRLNNRLRRSVEAALGGLTLMSPDPARRLAAAAAVFKSRDASALPTLDAAIAKETDGRVSVR
jgi:urea transport system permease protein